MEYRAALNAIGAKVSMSGKGNCYEFKPIRPSGPNDPVDRLEAQNAVVETFFKTIKSELIWRTAFQTRQQAHTEIAHYIDGFYNPVRRHSACGYESPIRYEMINDITALSTLTKQVHP